VTVDDSGIAPIPGSEQLVARTGGADGLLVNPQNSRQLFVGGQQPRLFVVDTTNPDPATNWWRQTANQSIFNVVAASQDTVLGFTLDGARTNSRHRIVGGTLPNNVNGELVTLGGYDINVTAVIAVPGGRYLYTSSSNGGEVSGVGWITFDAAPATTAVTAAPHLYVHAHSGLYEPFSNTLLFWGESTVSQYTVAGVNIGTVDVSALIGTGGQSGFRHLDNGVADGNGRVLLAANNGMLLWFDLRATMQISSALSNSFRITPADGLDAVTAPVCVN
jgi:hypothetical protein